MSFKKKTPLGMFSSKVLNNNTAMFTKPGLSTGIGDPYQKKGASNSKLNGKQFQVGRSSKVYFDVLKPLSIVPTSNGDYKSDPYASAPHKPDTKQLTQDPGFGSKNGRGIQNTVRASRMYSEKLRLEQNAMKRSTEVSSALKTAASTILDASGASSAYADPGITLFDRCNAGEDDDSLRLKPGVGASKRYGTTVTSASLYGANVNDTPPVGGAYARVAITKQFYNDQALELPGSSDYLNM